MLEGEDRHVWDVWSVWGEFGSLAYEWVVEMEVKLRAPGLNSSPANIGREGRNARCWYNLPPGQE